MIVRFRLVILCAVMALLAACAGPVPRIDASVNSLSPVKTIAVIRPPEPKTYTVMNFGHPGMAFGLIGGLIAGGDQASKQDQLSAAFKAQGVGFASHLASQIALKLGTAGYETAVEDGPWEEAEGRYRLPFDKINSKADAVLVVSPTIVGFIATGAISDYLPTMTAVVTLLGKDRKEQLYRGFHSSGWAPKADGWKVTPPKKTFPDFDTLMANTKASASALDNAGTAIAETVSADLRR
jgi:hypothetical protein